MTSTKLAGGGGVMGLIILIALACLGPGCTQLGLNTASRSLAGPPEIAETALAAFGDDGPIVDQAEWPARREALKSAFEDYVYGPYPRGVRAKQLTREILDEDFLGV